MNDSILLCSIIMHVVRNLVKSKPTIISTGPLRYCRCRCCCRVPETLQEPVYHLYTVQSDLALTKFGSSAVPDKVT